MKPFVLSVSLALLLAFPLRAQSDAAAARRGVEAENRQALSGLAARPVVVAQQSVPRKDFHLWLSHLKEDGRWCTDANWYPFETTRLILSKPGADGSLDIVWSEFLDTDWSAPKPVSDEAVSPGNEIFPMLSPDGKRLYFASDGLFGMGGYDIYVATWDSRKQVWGQVRNLGIPFNSPGDDLFFCDTPDGRYSLLASNRSCGKDSVVIYVLRQETPVYSTVTPAEAERLSRLSVTSPENGYVFAKGNAGKVPALSFETPEETFDYTLHVGGEGAFAPDNHLPAGLVYQIQLFVSSNKVSVKQLKGVRPVYIHAQRSGKSLYAAGLFRSYAEAEQALGAVRRAGFPSAFVIAFDGGSPIGLQKARKKESSVKVVTEEVRIVR